MRKVGLPREPDGPDGKAAPRLGTFVFSLDAELAWGTFDEGGFRTYRRHLENTRPSIVRLLGLLERHRISATWAFVGHLFLRSCRRERPEDDPHPDVLTPRYRWYPMPWHRIDPATNRDQDPFWYGDDIVDQVRNAVPRQEIGCHTFSHILMNDPAVTPEIAHSQIAACCTLARRRGLTLRSFVFPRHSVAHLGVLAECGMTCYRGPEEPWYRNYPGPVRRTCHFLQRLLALTPPTYSALTVDRHGLVNIPSSMFLMPPDGLRRLIPGSSRVMQARRGLRRAVETGGVFHLWLHPWNMGSSPQVLEWIGAILETASELRSQGRLRVMTMGGLAKEVLTNARPHLRSRGGIAPQPSPYQLSGTGV